jgi:hypothetical protein
LGHEALNDANFEEVNRYGAGNCKGGVGDLHYSVVTKANLLCDMSQFMFGLLFSYEGNFAFWHIAVNVWSAIFSYEGKLAL